MSLHPALSTVLSTALVGSAVATGWALAPEYPTAQAPAWSSAGAVSTPSTDALLDAAEKGRLKAAMENTIATAEGEAEKAETPAETPKIANASKKVVEPAVQKVSAEADASGPGEGCIYGYSVTANGLWADQVGDRDATQHMRVEFFGGISPLPEAAANLIPSPACPQYNEMHADFLKWLVGDDTEGRYDLNVHEGETFAQQWAIGTIDAYAPEKPGALSGADIQWHGQSPREVADTIEAWMVQTYPGATLECVMLPGYQDDKAVKTGHCFPGFP